MLQHATYLLLDAARMAGRISEATTRNPANDSLYRGTRDESLAAVAPYLFRFMPEQPFAHWYLRQGWGQSWGVLIKSTRPLAELAAHFRNFLLVKTETGQNLYFRFYDPRVIRVFLPTCDAAQLREFFGPVDYFLVEDEDPGFALRFWHENGVLRTQRLDVADIVAAAPDVEPLPDTTEEDMAAALAAMNLPAADPQETAPDPVPAAAPEAASRPPAPVPEPPPAAYAGAPEPSAAQKKKWNLFD